MNCPASRKQSWSVSLCVPTSEGVSRQDPGKGLFPDGGKLPGGCESRGEAARARPAMNGARGRPVLGGRKRGCVSAETSALAKRLSRKE